MRAIFLPAETRVPRYDKSRCVSYPQESLDRGDTVVQSAVSGAAYQLP